MDVSAIVKILLSFSGVLLLNRFRVPLGLGLIGGGIFLEYWAGKVSAGIVSDIFMALSRFDLWLLLINISLITELGYFMSEDHNAQTIIAATRRWGGRHGYAVSLIAIPAAIGLVPMPGGALFSAPLIGESTKGIDQPPEWKAAVNYWFRHIMEYWWPLYPVVIVTLSIFTLNTWQFMAMQAPFTLVSIAAGYVFLLKGRVQSLTINSQQNPSATISVFRVLLPIVFIVLCTLILPGVFKVWLPYLGASVWKLLGMLSGLIGALLWIVMERQGKSEKRLFQHFWTKKTANMLMTLAGVMVFQSLLEASGLLPQASYELSNSHVPLEFIIAFLPFIAGLVTGIAIGFAGAAFPLVVGFMGVEGSGLTPISTLMLAFCMGYSGMMLSPVHLCFVLTKEYFMAPFHRMYRYLVPCVLMIMTTGIGLHVLFRIVGW